MTVVTLDLDLIVDIEAGVFPGEELVDQFPADLLFPEQHLKDLVAEEAFVAMQAIGCCLTCGQDWAKNA